MSIRTTLADWMARQAYALGYDAADVHNPSRKVLPPSRRQGRSEDQLLGYRDRETLRQECLNLRRNDPIMAAIGRTFADNIVGPGITPQAKTSSDNWNNESESYFREYAKIIDSRQRLNLRDMQRLTVTNRLYMGDMAYVLTAGGQLQPIEGERIKTPQKLQDQSFIVEGVKLSPDTGIPVSFYIYQREGDGRIDTSTDNFDEVNASDVFYVSAPFRFDQVRGIPDLACCCAAIKDLDDLVLSTLEKARLDAKNAYQITTDINVGGPGNLGSRLSPFTRGDGTQFERFDGPNIYYLRKGEEAKSLASNTPNAQYDSFTTGHLRRIGAALGVPYEFLMMDFSKSNFSNARSALLQIYNTVMDWQEWLGSSFNQRLWNWRISKAIKAREISPAPVINGISEWYKTEWSYPSRQWVDPQSQMQANLLAWQLGTDTITQMNRANGRDVQDTFREKVAEIGIAHAEAEAMNTKYPTLGLTWHDVISAQIPGQTVRISEQAPLGYEPNVASKPNTDMETK